MPWALNKTATSAIAGVSSSDSGSPPNTKLTKQSLQSGVDRRTQSVQLIDNSMSAMMPLSR
jgi:hypothetical protein